MRLRFFARDEAGLVGMPVETPTFRVDNNTTPVVLPTLLAELAGRPGAAPGVAWLAQGLAEAR